MGSGGAALRLRRAVHNNSVWCDTVARAHGRETHSTTACWLCTQPMPPFYPNLVTIGSNDGAQRVQLDYIERLLALDLPVGWGIKDSYACLDLAAFGFEIALDAQWYAREPAPLRATDDARLVTTTRSGDPSVRSMSAPDSGAGLDASGSGDTIGIYNLVGPPDGVVACLAAVVQASPNATLVGWGDNVELANLAPFGFRALGPLRVWLRR